MSTNESNLASFAKEDLKESIEFVYNDFAKRALKFEVPHFLTRRLASIASLMVLFGLLTIAGNFSFIGELKLAITDKAIISELCSSLKPFNIYLFDFGVIVIISALFLYNLLVKKIEFKDVLQKHKLKIKTKKFQINLILQLFILGLVSSFLLFKWDLLSFHFLFWGILIFVISYSSNRKYGYTRGFSRNRMYAQKAELLYADKILNSDEKEDKNLRLQLHELLKKAGEESHKDIVGDYIDYGNSALKWLSTKKQ